MKDTIPKPIKKAVEQAKLDGADAKRRGMTSICNPYSTEICRRAWQEGYDNE